MHNTVPIQSIRSSAPTIVSNTLPVVGYSRATVPYTPPTVLGATLPPTVTTSPHGCWAPTVSSTFASIAGGFPFGYWPPASTVPSASAVPHIPPTTTIGMLPPINFGAATPRRGKALPVDAFTGEDAEIRFEDWQLTLSRAATWNGWSDEEALIQLAGHLRRKAQMSEICLAPTRR